MYFTGLSSTVLWLGEWWFDLTHYASSIELTLLGRVTHIGVSILYNHWFRWWLDADQAEIMLTGPVGKNFSGIFLKNEIFSLTNLYLNMLPAKVTDILSRPQCVKGLDRLYLSVDGCTRCTPTWITQHRNNMTTDEDRWIKNDHAVDGKVTILMPEKRTISITFIFVHEIFIFRLIKFTEIYSQGPINN